MLEVGQGVGLDCFQSLLQLRVVANPSDRACTGGSAREAKSKEAVEEWKDKTKRKTSEVKQEGG